MEDRWREIDAKVEVEEWQSIYVKWAVITLYKIPLSNDI